MAQIVTGEVKTVWLKARGKYPIQVSIDGQKFLIATDWKAFKLTSKQAKILDTLRKLIVYTYTNPIDDTPPEVVLTGFKLEKYKVDLIEGEEYHYKVLPEPATAKLPTEIMVGTTNPKVAHPKNISGDLIVYAEKEGSTLINSMYKDFSVDMNVVVHKEPKLTCESYELVAGEEYPIYIPGFLDEDLVSDLVKIILPDNVTLTGNKLKADFPGQFNLNFTITTDAGEYHLSAPVVVSEAPANEEPNPEETPDPVDVADEVDTVPSGPAETED